MYIIYISIFVLVMKWVQNIPLFYIRNVHTKARNTKQQIFFCWLISYLHYMQSIIWYVLPPFLGVHDVFFFIWLSFYFSMYSYMCGIKKKKFSHDYKLYLFTNDLYWSDNDHFIGMIKFVGSWIKLNLTQYHHPNDFRTS